MSTHRIVINPNDISERQAKEEFEKTQKTTSRTIKIMQNDYCLYEARVNFKKGILTGIWAKFKKMEDITLNLKQLDIEYTKEIFYQLIQYLTIGYLNISKEDSIGLVYLVIKLQIDLGEQLDKFVCQTHGRNLWETILYVFNHDLTKYQSLMEKYIEANPDLIVDSRNKELTRYVVGFKSLDSMIKFLRLLTKTITKNYTKQVHKEDKELIEYLLKYYIYKNNLDTRNFSRELLFDILGSQISSDAIDGKEGIKALIEELSKKEKSLKELRRKKNNEFQEASMELNDIQDKIKSLDKMAQSLKERNESFIHLLEKSEYESQPKQKNQFIKDPPKQQELKPTPPKQKTQNFKEPEKKSWSSRQPEQPRTSNKPLLVHFSSDMKCSLNAGSQYSCGHMCCNDCIRQKVISYYLSINQSANIQDVTRREAKCFQCKSGIIAPKDLQKLLPNIEEGLGELGIMI